MIALSPPIQTVAAEPTLESLLAMAIRVSAGAGCATVFAIVFVPAAIAANFLHSAKWLIIVPVCVVLFAFAIAVLPRRRKITPEQFALELEAHLLGTDGESGWDDTTAVAIADPRLDVLRVKLQKFDSLSTDERRKEFIDVIDSLKKGEIPDVEPL